MWAAEELTRQLREFTSTTHDDLEPHPKDYRFFIEPNPDPTLFDDERYRIGIQELLTTLKFTIDFYE